MNLAILWSDFWVHLCSKAVFRRYVSVYYGNGLSLASPWKLALGASTWKLNVTYQNKLSKRIIWRHSG